MRDSKEMRDKRSQERIDNYWDNSIRLFLKNETHKHLIKMVNCSESGLCIDVPMDVEEFESEARAQLLFQVGGETCAFSATIRWISPVAVPGQAKGVVIRRYGAKIDRGTETNPELYLDYVRFLFLKRRFM